MIVVNKEDNVSDIFLPLGGLSSEPVFTLKVKSLYDNSTSSYQLTDNYSDFKKRYFNYKVEFKLKAGLYLYEVLDSKGVLLTGNLRVVADKVKVIEPKNNSEYIIYGR